MMTKIIKELLHWHHVCFLQTDYSLGYATRVTTAVVTKKLPFRGHLGSKEWGQFLATTSPNI